MDMKPELWITLLVGIGTVAIALITVWAIFEAPKRALEVQRKLDMEREAKQRRLNLFKTLMTYRATLLAPQFVQALNMIELEFDAPEEKDIRDAWKELLDQFGNWTGDQRAIDKANELIAELLLKMGKTLGYSFDKVYIKKGAYYPKAHEDVEDEQNALRRKLLALLAGETKLPVAVFEQKFQEIIPPERKTLAAGENQH